MDTTKAVTHVSLCAGYGGIDLGLNRAIPNLRTIAFSEIEAFACANLVSKMEAGLMDCAPVWTDLKTFPYGKFHGRVDILSGGYPCQPFSAAGKRAGADDPRHLWPFIAAGIRFMRPKMCFFENVEGHITLGLSSVISDLEELGYKVSWGVFSAAECGAPHQRKRVFILAYDTSLRIQGCWPDWIKESRSHARQALPMCGGDAGGIWPSRPGQSQHGWEPPRVVGNSPSKRLAIGGTAGEMESESISSEVQGSKLASTIEQSDAACGTMEDTKLLGRGRRDHGDETELRGEIQAAGSRPCELADNHSIGLEGWEGELQESERRGDVMHATISSQGYAGEVMGNTSILNGSGQAGGLWQTQAGGTDPAPDNGEAQSTLGGDIDGSTGRMDYAELYISCDNRTDELRLLGNGVVPATAERAFRTLLKELLI